MQPVEQQIKMDMHTHIFVIPAWRVMEARMGMYFGKASMKMQAMIHLCMHQADRGGKRNLPTRVHGNICPIQRFLTPASKPYLRYIERLICTLSLRTGNPLSPKKRRWSSTQQASLPKCVPDCAMSMATDDLKFWEGHRNKTFRHRSHCYFDPQQFALDTVFDPYNNKTGNKVFNSESSSLVILLSRVYTKKDYRTGLRLRKIEEKCENTAREQSLLYRASVQAKTTLQRVSQDYCLFSWILPVAEHGL